MATRMNGKRIDRTDKNSDTTGFAFSQAVSPIVRENQPQTGYALIDMTVGDNDSPAADIRDAFLSGLRDGSIVLKSRDTDTVARENRIAAYQAMEEQRRAELPLRSLIAG